MTGFKKQLNQAKADLASLNPEIPTLIKGGWRDFLNITNIDLGWFAIWIFIYSAFLIIDIFMPKLSTYSNILKYSGIILCLVYAHQKSPSDHRLLFALGFTFLADTLLVWTPYEYAGVLIFCIAQFLHTLRLGDNSPISLGIYASALIAFYALLRMLHIEALYAITSIYALQLFLNFLLSKKKYHQYKEHFEARAALYGYILFLGCDICVGLRHLMLDGVLPTKFLTLTAFMVWVFYYPSQVLLANSSFQKIKE